MPPLTTSKSVVKMLNCTQWIPSNKRPFLTKIYSHHYPLILSTITNNNNNNNNNIKTSFSNYTLHSKIFKPILSCQRRYQSGLAKLLQNKTDPYLQPIQELNISKIAHIALEEKEKEKKGLQHLWDGLNAINATLRMQVEDHCVSSDELNAALLVYNEVMRHAPFNSIKLEENNLNIEDSNKSINKNNMNDIHLEKLERVPMEEWELEWKGPLEEFRIIFRATGDTRV